ncbi:GerMN domain-containing protein [Anaerobacillus sp. MEB173]|uniref:GerMN domain-containing protein n=1 Tax=Anaerobacillus sp. MEB173 TaxID=3383345 RepID=UPI003F8F2CC3
MLPYTKKILISFSFVLILAACGQGVDQVDESPQDESDITEETSGEDTVHGGTEELEENEQSEEVAEETETETEAEADEPAATTITLYFSDSDLMKIYRVEREITVVNEDELMMETLQTWVNGPEEDGLTNLLPEGVVVQTVEDVNGVAHVSFSDDLLHANLGSSGEMFLLEQLAMIMEQFGYGETLLLIDGEVVPEFLGHMDTSQPIQAGDPEQYETK